MRQHLIRSLATVALAGCPEDGGGVDDDHGLTCESLAEQHATCTLGTGLTTYQALADGDGIDVEAGSQGGFHVFGSIRVTGIHPGDKRDPQGPEAVDLDLTVTTVDGWQVGRARLRGPLNVRSDGQVELVGEVIPLDIDGIDEVAGTEATFAVAVEDNCGTSVGDAVSVVLMPGT